MSTIKPNFMPLWPIPFGYANIGQEHHSLNKQLISDIEIERTNNVSRPRTFGKNKCSWQSELSLEKKYESFYKLSRIIKSVAIPILESSGISRNMNTEVCHLWANVIFEKGGWSNPHIHGSGTTLWSGVYYPKGMKDEKDLDEFIPQDYMSYGIMDSGGFGGSLVIKDLNISKKMIRLDLDHDKYYGSNFTVIPRESLLVLFPAWVEHYVTPTTNDFTRYSISFGVVKTTKAPNPVKSPDNVTIEKV